MDEPVDRDAPLTRTAASAAVEDVGWRYLLNVLAASVPVASMAQGAEAASAPARAPTGSSCRWLPESAAR